MENPSQNTTLRDLPAPSQSPLSECHLAAGPVAPTVLSLETRTIMGGSSHQLWPRRLPLDPRRLTRVVSIPNQGQRTAQVLFWN